LTAGKRYNIYPKVGVRKDYHDPCIGSLARVGDRTLRLLLHARSPVRPSATKPLELDFNVPKPGSFENWCYRKFFAACPDAKNTIEGKTTDYKHHIVVQRDGKMYKSWARVHVFDCRTADEIYTVYLMRAKEPLM